MTWLNRFDRLLKAMSHGEPHKAEKKAEKAASAGKSTERPKPSE